MNIRRTLLSTTAVSLTLVLSACDVEQTEPAELPEVDVAYESGQAPGYDVDVRKTQEGEMPEVDTDVRGGNLPEFDVDAPDVSVGSREVDVTVPDVDVSMQEKTVTVPDVNIDMPDDDDNDKK